MAQEPQQSEPVEEFEREPVPPRALLGLKSYVGMFAGEHVAGTELTIGPLSSPPVSVPSTSSSACWSGTCWRS